MCGVIVNEYSVYIATRTTTSSLLSLIPYTTTTTVTTTLHYYYFNYQYYYPHATTAITTATTTTTTIPTSTTTTNHHSFYLPLLQQLQDAPGRQLETRCTSGGIDHAFINYLVYGNKLRASGIKIRIYPHGEGIVNSLGGLKPDTVVGNITGNISTFWKLLNKNGEILNWSGEVSILSPCLILWVLLCFFCLNMGFIVYWCHLFGIIV